MKQLLYVLLLCALAAGCSSKPKESPDVYTKRNKAAEYTGYGNTYYESALYDQALKFYQMALELNISVQNESGMAENYNSIGKVYIATGSVETGLDYFLTAFELSIELNNTGLYVKTAANLSEIYLRSGEEKKAGELIEKALKEAESLKDNEESKALLFHNAGVLYKQEGDYEAALTFFLKAKSLNENNEQLRELASNHYMIASVYSKEERYEEAVNSLNTALELDKRVEHSYGIAKDIDALAVVYAKTGEIETSYEYYRKAALMYNTLRMKLELMRVLENLIKAAESLGLADDAEQYREDYKLLKEIEE